MSNNNIRLFVSLTWVYISELRRSLWMKKKQTLCSCFLILWRKLSDFKFFFFDENGGLATCSYKQSSLATVWPNFCSFMACFLIVALCLSASFSRRQVIIPCCNVQINDFINVDMLLSLLLELSISMWINCQAASLTCGACVWRMRWFTI